MLFDPLNTNSPDANALFLIADLLARAPDFRELAEITGADEAEKKANALAKIVVGIHSEPANASEYDATELATLFCEAQIFPPPDAAKVITKNDGSNAPYLAGTHALFIRRIARDAEIAGHAKRNDVFLFFYDRICSLEDWLIRNADSELCPRIQTITPTTEAAFGMVSEVPAQGEYLWAHLLIAWGDPEAAG